MRWGESFGALAYVRARLISEDISSLEKTFYDEDTYYKFLFDIKLLIVDYDSFIFLDKSLLIKICDFINIMSFRFSDNEKIRKCRKTIIDYLKFYNGLGKTYWNNIRNTIIENERKDRGIPDNVLLTYDMLLELYKNDFSNYAALINCEGRCGDISLFSFLSTVQKVYTDYPDFFKDDLWRAGFYCVMYDYSEQEKLQDKTYLAETKSKILENQKDKQKKKSKIICLPTSKIVNS